MHDAAQFHFNAYEISNNFAEAAVMDTCARLQAHSVITCTTKHVFWQISHDFGDKYPMTLTTNIPRERRQISVENDGFWEITRILLQIRCYLCRCSSFPQNLSISNHYFVFLRQVMEEILKQHCFWLIQWSCWTCTSLQGFPSQPTELPRRCFHQTTAGLFSFRIVWAVCSAPDHRTALRLLPGLGLMTDWLVVE